MAHGDQVRPAGTPSVKFTYDDFVNFPDDGKRHEIIDGEHYVTPSPITRHQAVSMNLSALLWQFLKANPIGRVFAAPFDVVLSYLDVVEPDLLYISRERPDILTDKHVRGAPDLVVEILSPGTRRTDEVAKRKLYERFGVQEYWIADVDLNAISVHRRVDDVFDRVAELRADRHDVLTSPLLPGFAAPLVEVFATPGQA